MGKSWKEGEVKLGRGGGRVGQVVGKNGEEGESEDEGESGKA